MPTVTRSSKTGKFVTPKYAKKHKATTQTETVKPLELGKVTTVKEVRGGLYLEISLSKKGLAFIKSLA